MPWGIRNLTYSATAVVGTASTTVVAADATRRYLRIQNSDGTAAVWLRLGTAAAAVGVGIGLTAMGSPCPTVELTQAAGNLWTGAVTGIGNGGTALLTIVSGT